MDITVNLNAGDDATPKTQTSIENQHNTYKFNGIVDPVREGYIFKGWKDSLGYEIKKGQTICWATSSPITFTAIWEAVKFDVLCDADTGLFGSTDRYLEKEQTFGGNYVLPNNANREGYHLVKWVDQEGNEITSTTPITSLSVDYIRAV